VNLDIHFRNGDLLVYNDGRPLFSKADPLVSLEMKAGPEGRHIKAQSKSGAVREFGKAPGKAAAGPLDLKRAVARFFEQ
jgi:hypothetical protein